MSPTDSDSGPDVDAEADADRDSGLDSGSGPDDLELVIVAAVAENGVIGADGEIPWHYPTDLRHFKETTTGHPVIMGRRTFEGILARLGEPLPGRTNVVLSRGDPDLPAGVVHADSVPAAIEAAREVGAGRAYVIGGAAVYEQFLPAADRLVLTEVDAAPEGDAHFPEWDPRNWTEVERREPEPDLAFVTYERRPSADEPDGT